MSSEFWIIHVTQTVRVTHSKNLTRQAYSNTQVTPEGSQLEIQLARDLLVGREVLAAPQALSSVFSLPSLMGKSGPVRCGQRSKDKAQKH